MGAGFARLVHTPVHTSSKGEVNVADEHTPPPSRDARTAANAFLAVCLSQDNAAINDELGRLYSLPPQEMANAVRLLGVMGAMCLKGATDVLNERWGPEGHATLQPLDVLKQLEARFDEAAGSG